MFGFISYLVSAAFSASSSGPALAVDNCRFGETYAFSAAQCDIALTNTGDAPIRISDIKPFVVGDFVEPAFLTIAPNEHTYLHVTLNTGNGVGNVQHRFKFLTNEKDHEQRGFGAYGFVMSVLDQAKPQFDFGVVDLEGELPQKTLLLSSHDSPVFKISKILEKPDYLDVTVAPDGQTLIARILPTASWGLHVDFVKLGIESAKQREAWVVVKADMHGDVVPSSNPFDMSLLRFGNDNSFLIRLTSRSGKNFETGKIGLEGVVGEAKILPCSPEIRGCRTISLKISDQQPAGSIKGKISIELPDFKQRLTIAVWGLIVSKDVRIKSVDDIQSANAAGGGKSVESQKFQNGTPSDLHKALESAFHQASDVPPAGSGPLLKWSVANGSQIYGFQVFRSSSETGPFVLINSPTIRSSTANDDSSAYQYRDNTALSGKTYWYYIGVVNEDGTKQQLTGPQKVEAK